MPEDAADVAPRCRRCGGTRRRSRTSSAADQAGRLQVDPPGPVARASRAKTGPADRVLRRDRCRDGCGSRGCRAHRRSAARNPSARATSAAVQCAARSAPTVVSAPMKVPSGLGVRGQMWPLSRWVCMSTKAGQHHRARAMSTASRIRPSRDPVAVDGDATVRIRSPGWSEQAGRDRHVVEPQRAGRRAGCGNRSCSRFMALSCHCAAACGDRNDRPAEDHDAVSAISTAPRTCAGCSAGSPPRGCGRRGPSRCPPVPATNSATTAPISARPPAIRRPPRK